ncbi:hypothetical protein P7C70_g1516, partial [Phenoliferia sp. Uapishka_3]
MTPEVALHDLLLDAQYFGMSNLAKILDEVIKEPLARELKSQTDKLQALRYAREITLDDLTSGKVRFEEDWNKWPSYDNDDRFKAISLVGDSLPPLIRLTKVQLKFRWWENEISGTSTHIFCSALEDELKLPQTPSGSNARIKICQRGWIAERTFDSLGDYPNHDSTIKIDGYLGGMDTLHSALKGWRLGTDNFGQHSAFIAAIRNLVASSFVEEFDFSDRGQRLELEVFADEVLITPVLWWDPDFVEEEPLDGAGFSMVFASCRSRANILGVRSLSHRAPCLYIYFQGYDAESLVQGSSPFLMRAVQMDIGSSYLPFSTHVGMQDGLRFRAASATDASSFTVILQGMSFVLSSNQIKFDSPNWFISAFQSGFEESTTRIAKTDRSPVLFHFILEHLSGYETLPLPPISSMSSSVALRNLLLDAQYFGLARLEEKVAEEIEEPSDQRRARDKVVKSLGFAQEVALKNLLSGALRLERDVSKWPTYNDINIAGEGKRPIPLVGGTLPPLFRISNVQMRLESVESPHGSESLEVFIPAIPAKLAIPLSTEDDKPPLVLSQHEGIAQNLYSNSEVDIESDPLHGADTLLRIDGHPGGLEPLHRTLSAWPDRRANSPRPEPWGEYLSTFHKHFEAVGVKVEVRQCREVECHIFADEVFLVAIPLRITNVADGKQRLDAIGLSLVTANCCSYGSQVKRLGLPELGR